MDLSPISLSSDAELEPAIGAINANIHVTWFQRYVE